MVLTDIKGDGFSDRRTDPGARRGGLVCAARCHQRRGVARGHPNHYRYLCADILINNAGTGARLRSKRRPWPYGTQMDVHAKGVFLGTKYAIPEMRKAGGGSIINVSSIYGLVKSHLRRTTPPKGPSGSLPRPPPSNTPRRISASIRCTRGTADTPSPLEAILDAQRREWSIARTPLGRLGTADDVAYGMLYLASDESAYVTGADGDRRGNYGAVTLCAYRADSLRVRQLCVAFYCLPYRRRAICDHTFSNLRRCVSTAPACMARAGKGMAGVWHGGTRP